MQDVEDELTTLADSGNVSKAISKLLIRAAKEIKRLREYEFMYESVSK